MLWKGEPAAGITAGRKGSGRGMMSVVSRKEGDPGLPTATAQLVAVIRERILAGVLAGGTRLHQHNLAAELGVSHIPVREALRILENEGFVVGRERRGMYVAGLTLEEAVELGELRKTLEPMAIELSVPRVTPAILTEALALKARLDQEQDATHWMALNWEFHRVLYGAAGRPRLLEMLQILWHNVDRYCRLMSRKNQGRHFVSDHQKLIQAYRRKDAAAASRSVIQHIEHIERRLFPLLTSGAEAAEG